MPEFKDVTDEITKTARDAAYVVVGLGVLGFQRAQVRRQELQKRLTERNAVQGHLVDVRGEVTKRVKDVDEAVEQVIGRIEATLAPIEERLWRQ
jgi:glucose-6-phosphate-specific signal transduction histidine kinase